MVGHAIDRRGLKDSENAPTHFFPKSSGPDFDFLVLICNPATPREWNTDFFVSMP